MCFISGFENRAGHSDPHYPEGVGQARGEERDPGTDGTRPGDRGWYGVARGWWVARGGRERGWSGVGGWRGVVERGWGHGRGWQGGGGSGEGTGGSRGW